MTASRGPPPSYGRSDRSSARRACRGDRAAGGRARDSDGRRAAACRRSGGRMASAPRRRWCTASSRRSRCGEAGWDTADRVRRGKEGDRCGVRRAEVDRRCDRRSSWDLPPRCRGHRAPQSRRSTSGGLQRCKEDRDRNDTSPYRGVVRREDASGRADCNTQWPIPGVACCIAPSASSFRKDTSL